MQVIENMTVLRGRVLEHAADPARPGWERVDMQVDDSAPVAGQADLLGRHTGSRLAVWVDQALLARSGGLQPGARLKLRARFSLAGATAEREPQPEDFQIERPQP